eukprot:TRINITY_DN5089_c0_g1_i4.p1 TRINITY_DN5089_c0_g1~~TRINITY_DN5089_c0_g1_i4.p1  ORF type:complete len:166 (-),score=21.55 TRINITY_DN5089_c0_g1_i4:263-760(-)
MSLLGLVRTTLAVIIAVWVYQTVGEYSEGSPITWGGDHIAMTAACGSLFDLLQKFLVLTVAIACFEVAALLMIAFSGLLPCIICCLPCVACAGCFASLYYFVLSIVGIFTVYGIDKSQCADCQDMLSCSWYTFIGMFIFGMAAGCFEVCCLHKAPEEMPLLPPKP